MGRLRAVLRLTGSKRQMHAAPASGQTGLDRLGCSPGDAAHVVSEQGHMQHLI